MKQFITYGDRNYAQSARRLAEEAQALGLFDVVHVFTPDDLPDSLRAHPLMQYARGGGYWLWKPWIIRQCLSQMTADDVLVYADAGCTVQPSAEWNTFFRDLKHKSVVTFRLGYKNKWFCRRSLLDYAERTTPHWGEYRQVLSGLLLMRGTDTARRLTDDWLTLMTEHPDYVLDVTESERASEAPCFREHRHDQSVLNACLYRYRHDIRIRWENVERLDPIRPQAVLASRLSDHNPHRPMPRFTTGKYIVRTLIGKPLALLQQFYWEKLR